MKHEFNAEYYNLEQAAEILQIDPRTLANRISLGKNHPPYCKPSRGLYLFPKREFHKWIEKSLSYEIAS